jgi:hypothetical protein
MEEILRMMRELSKNIEKKQAEQIASQDTPVHVAKKIMKLEGWKQWLDSTVKAESE